MSGYNIQHNSAESSNDGTLVCIKQGINYKLPADLSLKNLNQRW